MKAGHCPTGLPSGFRSEPYAGHGEHSWLSGFHLASEFSELLWVSEGGAALPVDSDPLT